MPTRITTNIAELGLFQRDLDAFETSLPLQSISPSDFTGAVEYLEALVRRITLASPTDGYQMLRLFALRYLDENAPQFNSYNVLMTITSSFDGPFKQLATPMLYEMAGLLIGNTYLTDDTWFNSVNRMPAVKLFFDCFAGSGLRLLANPASNMVDLVTEEGPLEECDKPTCTLLTGLVNPRVILTGFDNPFVTMRPDSEMMGTRAAILSKAEITSLSGKLVLGPGFIFTLPARTLLQWADVLTVPYSPGSATPIKLAGPLHRCEMLCLSNHAGNYLNVLDIKFLTPN